MQKKLLILLLLATSFSSGVIGARHRHRSKKIPKTHQNHQHLVQHKQLPEVTLDEVKAQEQEQLWGIDISHYQDKIEWEKMGDHTPHFIFLKATEGATNRDQKYEEYYEKIGRLAIPIGSYHFFTYKSTGQEQALNFLSIAKRKKGDLPLVLDAEFLKSMPARELVKRELLAFITQIYMIAGHYPMVYCNYKYYQLYLKDILPESCKLWIVDYQAKPSCDWTFWQTTNRFKIPSIKGYVDLNFFNGTKSNLQSMLF